jgi:hypothetical protein
MTDIYELIQAASARRCREDIERTQRMDARRSAKAADTAPTVAETNTMLLASLTTAQGRVE